MARVISVFLPMWPIDRRQRQAGVTSRSDDGPLIIAGRAGNRRVVTAACPAALDLGLRTGMTVSRAQALVPDLRIEADDAGADAAALERLALWLLQRVAPIVSADPPDGIVIDSTGADHLHGGEAAMLEALAGKLALSGITARLALADSWGAAHALARHGADGVTIVPPGASDAALAPLPLEALRLPAAAVAGLRDLGFETVGDLMDQPRAPLTRRFGEALCRRLDQARGLASEPIAPLRPEGLIEIRRALAEPIAPPETIAR